MQYSTLAAILVSVCLLGTEPPFGFILWDGIPTGYLFTLGLLFLAIGMAGELKRELRQDAETEEEISLVP